MCPTSDDQLPSSPSLSVATPSSGAIVPLAVGFLLLTAHPSSKWMDPAFSPQKEKVVVVYSDDVLQGSASILLRLSLPPHDAEGAIYVRRRLRLRYLIRQLGISLLCGDAGVIYCHFPIIGQLHSIDVA